MTAWGTGSPKREFVYSDDVAEACIFLMNLPDAIFNQLLAADQPMVNIGTGVELTIRELTETVKTVVGFAGDVIWDDSKPDGTPRKLLDVSRLADLGWRAKTHLRDGIELAYRDFVANQAGKAAA